MRSRHLEGKKVDTQKQRNRELVTRIKERRKGKDNENRKQRERREERVRKTETGLNNDKSRKRV
jgi:hypothetical protein